jgi:lipid II:glycine glycyltransferase (peptidoglycan interpeptide bridge formation enzyme)
MEKFEDSSDIIIVYYNKKKDRDLENERQAKKQELLKALETAPEKKIKGIKGDIEAIDSNTKNFEIRMGETKDYPDDAVIPVAGGFTLRYGGVASCLFGGTKNIIRNNTRSSHYLNYLRICKSIECGCDYHDLGYVLVDSPEINSDGTLGEMKPNKDFVGINEFKLSFGADYMELIGEYVLVGNKRN